MVPGADGFPKLHHPVSDVVVYMIPGPVPEVSAVEHAHVGRIRRAQPGGSNGLQMDTATRQMKEWDTSPV